MSTITVKVPDIGDFDAVEIIEVLVAEGDTVAVEDGLVSLESDKATMDVPSTAAGKVSKLLVGVGDKVAQGDAVAEIEAEGEDDAAASTDASDDTPADSADDTETETGSVADTADESSQAADTEGAAESDEGGPLKRASCASIAWSEAFTSSTVSSFFSMPPTRDESFMNSASRCFIPICSSERSVRASACTLSASWLRIWRR